MQFLLLLLLFLIFQSTVGQVFVYPEEAEATIGYQDETVVKCVSISVNSYRYTKTIIRQACNEMKAENGTEYIRTKRWLEFFPVINLFVADDTQKAEQNVFEENVKYMVEFLGRDTLPDSYSEVHARLNWDGAELISSFNYIPGPGKIQDVWTALINKTLYCGDASGNRLQLLACGRSNGQRKTGQLLGHAVSLGNFSSRGTIYKNRNIEEQIVLVDGQKKSATCRFLSSYYECELSRNSSCSAENYRECAEIVHLTPNKVFTRTFANNFTVVAADLPSYTTVINGTIAVHKMYFSKHVGLNLPFGSYADFNGTKVFGNARDKHNHFPIFVGEEYFELQHVDLDVLEAKIGQHNEIDEHRALIRPIEEISFLVPFYFVAAVSILIVAIILVSFKILNRKSPKTHTDLVVYFNNQCEEI